MRKEQKNNKQQKEKTKNHAHTNCGQQWKSIQEIYTSEENFKVIFVCLFVCCTTMIYLIRTQHVMY